MGVGSWEKRWLYGGSALKKQTRRKDHGLHPFIRQAVSETWGKRSTEALIHALMGGDWERAIDKVGTLTYIVSLACKKAGYNRSQPDIRVLRASLNVMGEVIDRENLDNHRMQLHNAVLAAQRLSSEIDEQFLLVAAMETKSRLALGSIRTSDFEALYVGMPQ
jgi:hypothetical protein